MALEEELWHGVTEKDRESDTVMLGVMVKDTDVETVEDELPLPDIEGVMVWLLETLGVVV